MWMRGRNVFHGTAWSAHGAAISRCGRCLAHRDTRDYRRSARDRERLAGPSWAGLLSTFPSLSLVVLIVTYLEAGPAEASRIAQVLPCGKYEHAGVSGGFPACVHRSGVAWGYASGRRYSIAIFLAVQMVDHSGFSRSHRKLRERGRWAVQPEQMLGRIVWTKRTASASLAAGVARCDLPGSTFVAANHGRRRDGGWARISAGVLPAGRDAGVVIASTLVPRRRLDLPILHARSGGRRPGRLRGCG